MKKKVLSMILVLALCVGLGVPAMASLPGGGAGTTQLSEYCTITNIVSTGIVETEDPEWYYTVYYTTGPTTITINEIIAPFYGIYKVEQLSENSFGERLSDDPIEPASGEWLIVDPDDAFGAYYSAGTSFILEEGSYVAGNLFNSPIAFYIVVGSSNAKSPAEVLSSWAVEPVNAAKAANLLPASLQSKYTQPATRAEFCALAVALYENIKGVITGRSTFTDTNDVNVQKAAAIGVVSGVGDNKFAPDQKLTREQAATMLSRLADAIGKPLTKQAATFADSASVSSWAADAVGQMQATGIMGGVGDNTFAPKSDYTREQSIVTIMRLYDLVK